jgi:uncharacterized cupredoxin-like copper-binding protein
MKFSFSAAVAAAGLALLSTQALADTTVAIDMVGEGGGAMSFKVDKPEIPAGKVKFVVTNTSMTENHEMVLVKLKSADQAIPLISAKHRVDESKLKTMGEVADLKPNDSGELDVSLKPGTYMILCNIKGHYEAGMWSKLTVKAGAAAN